MRSKPARRLVLGPAAAAVAVAAALILRSANAFQPPPPTMARTCESTRQTQPLNGWLGDLWSEAIEMATYGPAERRILAERRKRAAEEAAAAGRGATSADDEREEMTFAEARKRFESSSSNVESGDEFSDDDLSPAAFRQAAAAVDSSSSNATEPSPLDEFDGYALRDLLVAKWGAPLDVDFQRDASLNQVYCTVLPIAFGQRLKCRHETELDYLMHLQGIVEVLRRYDQLEEWVAFLEGTDRSPKAGTDSVPYRLNLNDEQKKRIL